MTISGIVALTLSPVMSAKLLKPGMEEHGLAGRIARDFGINLLGKGIIGGSSSFTGL